MAGVVVAYANVRAGVAYAPAPSVAGAVVRLRIALGGAAHTA